MPEFTVVIPVHNAAGLVGRTLDALFAQTFTDFDVVAVDDGSTDGSADVVAAYGRGVRLVRQANAGPAAARNAGIALATGRYVAFLDSDDVWFPWTLATVARAIAEHGSPAVVAGLNRFFNDEAELAAERAEPFRAEAFPDLLTFYETRPPTTFPTGAVVVRADALRAAGGFWPHRWWSEDVDLWVRLGTAVGFVRVEHPAMYGQRRHAANISHATAPAVLGLRHILATEQAGGYPGGDARRRGRRAAITFIARTITMQCLANGDRAGAWELYRRTAGWHVALGRLKYLVGFPVKAAVAAVARRRTARPVGATAAPAAAG